MTVAKIRPDMMADRLEFAINNETLSGRVDAIAHIGWFVSSDDRWDQMDEIQQEILNPSNSTSDYIKGYTFMWAELYGLLF